MDVRILISFIVLCVASCTGPSNKVVVEKNPEVEIDDPRLKLPLEEQLRLKIEDELAMGERIDTIILDHTFGMSRRAVIRHKDKLHRAKRIYPVYKTKNTRAFVYDLHFADAGPTRTYFDTYYVDDKLYKMECKPIIPKDSSPNDISAEAVQLFTRKYGTPDFSIPHQDSLNCDTRYWVESNLQIDIKCDKKEVIITYTDLAGVKEKLQDI